MKEQSEIEYIVGIDFAKELPDLRFTKRSLIGEIKKLKFKPLSFVYCTVSKRFGVIIEELGNKQYLCHYIDGTKEKTDGLDLIYAKLEEYGQALWDKFNAMEYKIGRKYNGQVLESGVPTVSEDGNLFYGGIKLWDIYDGWAKEEPGVLANHHFGLTKFDGLPFITQNIDYRTGVASVYVPVMNSVETTPVNNIVWITKNDYDTITSIYEKVGILNGN